MKEQDFGKDCPRNTLDMISLKIIFLFVVYFPVLWWKLNCWSELQFLTFFFFLVSSPSQNSYSKYVKNLISLKIYHRGYYHFSARYSKGMEFCIAETISGLFFFFSPTSEIVTGQLCSWVKIKILRYLFIQEKNLHTLAGRKPLHLSIASSLLTSSRTQLMASSMIAGHAHTVHFLTFCFSL